MFRFYRHLFLALALLLSRTEEADEQHGSSSEEMRQVDEEEDQDEVVEQWVELRDPNDEEVKQMDDVRRERQEEVEVGEQDFGDAVGQWLGGASGRPSPHDDRDAERDTRPGHPCAAHGHCGFSQWCHVAANGHSMCRFCDDKYGASGCPAEHAFGDMTAARSSMLHLFQVRMM